MLKGWHLYRQTDTVADSSVTYAQNRVDRIHASGSMDIGRYFFKTDSLLYIDPLEEAIFAKSYLILSGRCRELESHSELGPGDLIVVEGALDMIALHFLEESQVLVHSRSSVSIDRFKKQAEDMQHMLQELQRKDNYTKEHSDRVFQITKHMGLALGFHSKRIFNLNRAARFHDVGKVFIEDKILNKESALDSMEAGRIREHVHLGRELILEAYDADVYEIIRQHHERLDGSGYPRGLRGDEILPEARILGICDSYDAMTTDRVFRKGKSPAEAHAELRSMAGTKYDPDLVELFIKINACGAS